jgi:hypothetical protein
MNRRNQQQRSRWLVWAAKCILFFGKVFGMLTPDQIAALDAKVKSVEDANQAANDAAQAATDAQSALNLAQATAADAATKATAASAEADSAINDLRSFVDGLVSPGT